jgi:hypothetical protein
MSANDAVGRGALLPGERVLPGANGSDQWACSRDS